MAYVLDHNNWLHLANILFLLAYLVRDILWLRVLTVIATLCLIPYHFCCSLHQPIYWSTVFILINLVQIALLVSERRPVFMGEVETRLYRTLFQVLSPREFIKLLSLAEWKKTTPGQVLLRQHEPVSELMLISKGKGNVELDGRFIAEVGPNQFVGEMGFLTEENASASVTANVPMEYLSWPADILKEFFEESPQIHIKVQGVLGADLVEKLRREGFSAAHPSKIMDMYQRGELE
ncbi:MAG: popeye domain-containing protein [Pirellulales bacterium]|nr:popeye domain-containing protein [Pirellulales bacterium]